MKYSIHVLVFLLIVFQYCYSTASPRPDSPVLHAMPIQKPGPEYGNEYQAKALNVGPSMDVAVENDLIYSIGQGRLTIQKSSKDSEFKVIGTLSSLGNVRQIAVSNGLAFITSREDGMFIIDVRESTEPKLVYHYDSAELATGIAVSGELAAIGNRFAGIELLDVSMPSSPKHLATIRVGEAQSMVFHGSWLYAGLWGERALAVIDIANPSNPKLVKSVPLDGQGDGLDVRGHVLAVATGHHRPKKNGRTMPGDDAFGHGHGIEFFNISSPSAPARLAVVKFPPFYHIGHDMWGVVLQGDYAFVNDTHNGFFLLDIHDPAQPQCVGYHQLPVDSKRGIPSPVAGLAFNNGRVFLAGAFDDLYCVDTGLRNLQEISPKKTPKVPENFSDFENNKMPTYKVEGSIRSVVHWRDNLFLVAAGSAGVHIVRLENDEFIHVADYPTQGFARDVKWHGDKVYVAESLGGLSIWDTLDDKSWKRLGAYVVPGKSIHQIHLADDGNLVFLAVGGDLLHAVKLGENAHVELIYERRPTTGLFYREPFSPVRPDGRFLVQWHVIGLYEYNASNGAVYDTGYEYPFQMGTECGAALWKDGWVVTSRQGFFFLKSKEKRSPDEIGRIRVDGRALPGKPTVFENTLFIADPFVGHVCAVDLSDDSKPQMQAELNLTGHPGRLLPFNGKALIPAGRQGLILWDYSRESN